jgi:aminoglycoside phosphotransferase
MNDGYQPPRAEAHRWVERALGPGVRVLSGIRLTGGLTSWLDRLTVRDGTGDPFEVVLRRWPRGNPWSDGLVSREAAALTALAHHDIPAPQLLAEDETGVDAGDRCLLMTSLSGSPLLSPSDLSGFVRNLAVQLARIHRVPTSLEPTDPFGYDHEADRCWLGDPALARDATTAADPGAAVDDLDDSRDRSVLTHGDYQQYNVLWQDQRLTAVVDWTMAGRADRGYDVGHCRLNLAVLYSVAAAEQFLVDYQTEAGVEVDPRVDLRRLLGFDPVWQEFIPLQVAGRAPVDGPGMAGRVTDLIRAAVTRLG